MRYPSFIWAWRLAAVSTLAAATLGGCAGDSGSNSCGSFCKDFCQELGKCQIDGSSSCVRDCTSGLSSENCSGARPPDQLTCDELGALYQCAQYCATLCTRAPQCGSFDSKLCAEGCGATQPSICNPASVPARTCDQLKPELRLYEDKGRALSTPGTDFVGGGTSDAFGLCLSNSDCEGQRCDLTTNVCGPCHTDAECKGDFGAHICAPDGSCMAVECAEDADCFAGDKCDPAHHKCVRCLVDADCTGQTFPHCSPAKNTCVQCVADADCVGQPTSRGSHCGLNSPFESICVECNIDADCAGSGRSRCGIGICM